MKKKIVSILIAVLMMAGTAVSACAYGNVAHSAGNLTKDTIEAVADLNHAVVVAPAKAVRAATEIPLEAARNINEAARTAEAAHDNLSYASHLIHDANHRVINILH
ncbi:MAG: hypothetical protein IJ133_02550 [Clostridia bacterium]|nr:hypothetical protein [Clostridia bacterium]